MTTRVLRVVAPPDPRASLRAKLARAASLGAAHGRKDALPPQLTLTWGEFELVDTLLRAAERKDGE